LLLSLYVFIDSKYFLYAAIRMPESLPWIWHSHKGLLMLLWKHVFAYNARGGVHFLKPYTPSPTRWPLSILFGSSLLTNRSNLFRRLDLNSPLLTLVFSRLFGRTLYVKVRYSSYCHLSNSLFCDSCVSNLRCVFLLLKNFSPIHFVKIMLVIPSPWPHLVS
jgi:hypothetical protein